MTNSGEKINLGDATGKYISELSQEKQQANQQELAKFARWFGKERLISGLTPAEIESYAEQMTASDTDYQEKFALVKAFLAFAKKKGWTETNLSVHLKIKVKKGSARKNSSSRKDMPEAIPLTKQGYDELKAELASLRNERLNVIAEVRKAAADKDFRENAPLHAAREKKGHIEGRIMELEGILKSAVVIDDSGRSELVVGVGDKVVICEQGTDQEICYTLVTSREVDLKKGKISNASPMGQAIVGKEQGEMVEIEAPIGRLYYRIVRIER